MQSYAIDPSAAQPGASSTTVYSGTDAFDAAGSSAQLDKVISSGQSAAMNAQRNGPAQVAGLGQVAVPQVQANYVKTHASNLANIQDTASKHLGALDGQIKALQDKGKLNPLNAADQAQLAQLQTSRTQYNAAVGKFTYDAATKYGAAALGLSADQAQILGSASRGENGLNFTNVDLATFKTGNKNSDVLAKNAISDAQKTTDANTKAAADQATQDATNKTSADASAASLKTVSDSNQTMWDQASAHAADLVNTGLNTFDTALQGKSSQVSSLASTQVHSAGFADATSQGANAQTNLQAKGAAARGTLGSDLGSQAGTYLAGVAGQETQNAQNAQGVNAQGKIDLQNRNSQSISTKIDQLRQSGQIAASGQEQQINNLLQTYQNDNTSAENKQKIGGQIIGLVLGGIGAAATAAIMA